MAILRSGVTVTAEPEMRARQVQEESASESTLSDRDTNLALPDRTKLNVMNNEPSVDSAQPDKPAHTASTTMTGVDNASKTAAHTKIYTVTEIWTAELDCGLDEHPMETRIIGIFPNEDAANDTAADYAAHAFTIVKKSWEEASIGWKMPKGRLDITIN